MILISFLLITASFAADKPVCSAKAITRDCAFFKERENQAKITLPDGTYYENPLYNPKVSKLPEGVKPMKMPPPDELGATGVGSRDDFKADQEAADKALKDQADILDLLEGTGVSGEFKLAYGMSAPMGAIDPNFVMNLPWPPTQKGAEKKPVTVKEVNQFLAKKLGPQKFKSLNSVIERQKAPIEKKMQEQKQALQELMQKKQLEAEAAAQESANKSRREKRVRELFDYAKNQVEQIVSRGKPESQWSDVEKAMVEKVRALRLTDFNEAKRDTICISEPNNAFYNPNENTMSVCSGKLNYPDSDIIRSLGHEIGHSIDPCFFQMPVWKINKEKFDLFVKNAKTSEHDKLVFKEIFRKHESSYYDLKLMLQNKNQLDEMEKFGALEKTRESFSSDKYPFDSAYSCLTKKTGFREITKKDVKSTINYMKKSAALSDDKKRAQEITDDYEKYMKQYPQCAPAFGYKSQMQEVMGDMMGFLVQEKFISEKPPKNEEEVVGAFLFARLSCKSTNTTERPSTYEVSEYLFPQLNESHPQDDNRVNQIGLTLPGLADMVGCRRTGPSCFEHLSLTARSSNRKNSSSSSKEQGGQQ